MADALGRAVAAAHAKAPVVDAAPWIAALGGYIDEHVEAFRQYPEIFPAAESDALARLSRAAYQRIVPLLRERSRRGFVRRIHGDLHLGNIVLIDGKPVLFDAIEFSDIIASGDVFYDLAFLLMDLLERGLAFAAECRAQPLPHADPPDRRPRRACDAAVLPVDARSDPRQGHRGAAGAREGAEQAAIARSARAYFDFARQAITPPAPKFVAVGGLSGTGKTQARAGAWRRN